MPASLQINGAQSTKPVKFGELYTGRFFTGLWTNRSPLRDAATPQIYEKFYGNRGDNMIAGSNVEISNKLTVIRRPGNPIYDNTNTFSNIDSFDTFRVDKSLVDVFGSPTESIFTMVDTTTPTTGGGALYAEDSSNVLQAGDTATTVLTKATGAGQAFMKQVGNQLYIGDGVDNKKWSQSLFSRDSGNNSKPIPTNAYPFMSTFLLDSNHNMQQMIGVWVANITAYSLASEVLTLTVSSFGGTGTYATQPAGTKFMLWNMGAATWLNGATITLTSDYTTGGTSITGTWTGTHADASGSGLTGYLQANPNFNYDTTLVPAAGVSGAPITGGSVPTWGTTVPAYTNDFYGSTTKDGNVLWQNRGVSTQNWGLNPPDQTPTFTVSGAELSWQANTYYSIASIYQAANGYLWQVSTAGTTSSTLPATFATAPTVSTKIDILEVSIDGSNVATFTTESQSLSAGNTVKLSGFAVATFLNDQTVTVSATGLTATTFEATVASHPVYGPAADYGLATKAGTPTITDGTVVWTPIQTPASLTWAAGTHYHDGDFLISTTGAGSQYFMLRKNVQPFINTNVFTGSNPINMIGWNTDQSVQQGFFQKTYPQTVGDFSTVTPTSLNWLRTGNANFVYQTVDGAGELTGGSTDSGRGSQVTGGNSDAGNKAFAVTTTIFIPAAGQYSIKVTHRDGCIFSFDDSTGARKVSGALNDPQGHVQTVVGGYGNFGGASNLAGSNISAGNSGSAPNLVNTAVWFFPAAGNYGFEVDYAKWYHSNGNIAVTMGNQQLAVGQDVSGSVEPVWPVFTTSGATWNPTTERIDFAAADTVSDAGGQYTWINIGSVTDFSWNASIAYTLPGTQIIDSNNNQQGAIETGITSSTAPTWNTATNGLTIDHPNLVWINEGGVPATTTPGTISALSVNGYYYAIALVNTQDNTVSNIGPISAATGKFNNGEVVFGPASGLPTNLATIDTQADYVAIFRTADGFTTGLLVPSDGNTIYTVPLVQYILSGYVDTTPDTSLDNLIQAAAAGENTPPLPGAANLAFHLNRLWYSIGNTVYYTAGPLAPSGNGVNGADPISNRDTMPSIVKRLVPYSQGVIVFCVSDIYVIQTSGQAIYPGIPFIPGVGILSYNALDKNGTEIGFFTTDRQFLVMQTQGGVGQLGFPIADKFQLNDGGAGTSWNPMNVYVASYHYGQDNGWFVADGTNGWYKLITTPAPDGPPNTVGMTWSPFATIASSGLVKAIKSAETSPGVHALLLGPAGSGVKILHRDVTATTDGGTTVSNGTTYSAYAVFGSYVLAHPGQIAQVAFVTTDSVRVGSPLTLGLLIDEALPYYTQSFEILKDWTPDPPGLPVSKSFYGQRFYLSELPDSAAACRHLQVMIQWPAEAAPNELQTFTIFGCFVQEM